MKVEKMRKFVRFLGPFINGYGISLYQYGPKKYLVFVEHVPSMVPKRFITDFPSKTDAEDWFERQGPDDTARVYRILSTME